MTGTPIVSMTSITLSAAPSSPPGLSRCSCTAESPVASSVISSMAACPADSSVRVPVTNTTRWSNRRARSDAPQSLGSGG